MVYSLDTSFLKKQLKWAPSINLNFGFYTSFIDIGGKVQIHVRFSYHTPIYMDSATKLCNLFVFRLTPPYMLFLGFYTTLLKYMATGPMWNQKYGMDEKSCESNWWYNLLYINNFLGAAKMVRRKSKIPVSKNDLYIKCTCIMCIHYSMTYFIVKGFVLF